MNLVSNDIESYCLHHSRAESDVCRSLAEFTRQTVAMPQMISGPLVTQFLGTLLRTRGAKRVLEVGTFTGYSALAMAESLPKDGTVVTLGINADTMAIAERFWKKSPHGKKITGVLGEARKTMPKQTGPFDLIFIDADKGGYATYLDTGLKVLAEGGLIVADNCLWSGQVLDKDSEDPSTRALRAFNERVHQAKELENLLLPLRDGLNLIWKKSS